MKLLIVGRSGLRVYWHYKGYGQNPKLELKLIKGNWICKKANKHRITVENRNKTNIQK